MDYQKIRCIEEQDRRVLRLRLQAPKGNVLDGVMMREIGAALDAAAGNPALSLIVFDADGPHFSFGASVPEHTREQAPCLLATFHGIFNRLIELAAPTLAVVRGKCLGGGLELACFCQFVFADETAAFAVPEIKLGVFPPPASAFLPLKLGQAHADWLTLTGREIDAAEAHRIGLAQRVFPAAELEAGVRGFIEQEILPRSASSLRLAARASRWGFHRAFREHCAALERMYLDELMATADANEGIAAFLEKRAPAWRHR